MYFEKKIYDKVDSIENEVLDRVNDKPTKNPVTSIEWVLDDVITTPVYSTWTSFPDKVLHGEAQDTDGTRKIFRYGEMGNPESFEFGIETLSTMEGRVKYIHVTPNYVVYVNSTLGMADDPAEHTWIYRAPDIFTTPTLIAENTTGQAIGMSCDGYYDGFMDIILVAMYGRSKEGKARDLLMSTDGGLTFKSIKKTNPISLEVNSHWHAAWFDKYEGKIWASEGDTNNRNVHYTVDYGENWVTVETDKPWEEKHQPTLIFGWGERVMFGRDSSQLYTGLDSYERKNTSEGKLEIDRLVDRYTLRTDQMGSHSYPEKGIAITDDGQAYVMFRIDGKNATQLIATGDYGRSWQGVFATERNTSSFRTQMCQGVTHDGYIVAVVSEHPTLPASRMMYAKTLVWE